jgi:hypothetical protein
MSETKIKSLPPMLILAGFFGLILLIYLSSLDDLEDRERISQFKNNSALICKRSMNLYNEAVLVQQANGWSLYEDEYFQRDEQYLHIRSCEVKVKENSHV